MAIKVIYDCDTGGDDATAISIGVASKDIEVLGDDFPLIRQSKKPKSMTELRSKACSCSSYNRPFLT